MGFLNYAGMGEYEFDDDLLAHVKVVVSSKLRRQEGFFLNWTRPVSEGSGRVSLWMSPGIALVFRFTNPQVPELNRALLEALADTANSARGMQVGSLEELRSSRS